LQSEKQTFSLIMALSLVFLAFSVNLADDNNSKTSDGISFKYGIIGKDKGKPDSLFEVTDNSVLNSGDFIRIDFEMESKAFFYVILKSSNGDYSLFHSSSNLKGKSTTEAISTSLKWLEMDNKVGTETIYLISSKEPLSNLEDLFEEYQEVKKKLKIKFANKISAELLSLAQEKNEEPLQTRLERSGNIGGTFRAKEIDFYLFNQCSGDSIALEIVRIIHK